MTLPAQDWALSSNVIILAARLIGVIAKTSAIATNATLILASARIISFPSKWKIREVLARHPPSPSNLQVAEVEQANKSAL